MLPCKHDSFWVLIRALARYAMRFNDEFDRCGKAGLWGTDDSYFSPSLPSPSRWLSAWFVSDWVRCTIYLLMGSIAGGLSFNTKRWWAVDNSYLPPHLPLQVEAISLICEWLSEKHWSNVFNNLVFLLSLRLLKKIIKTMLFSQYVYT